MSILRDVDEMGLSSDSFLITGNNFPNNWEDPSPEELEREEREIDNQVHTLDTKEAWLERRRFISPKVEPVGFISGTGYYNINQTTSLDDEKQLLLNKLEDSMDDFFNKLEVKGVPMKTALDKEFKSLEKSVLERLRQGCRVWREKVPLEKGAPIDPDIPF